MNIEERLGTFLGHILGHTLRIAAPAIAETIRQILDKATKPTLETATPQPELRQRLLARIPPNMRKNDTTH